MRWLHISISLFGVSNLVKSQDEKPYTGKTVVPLNVWSNDHNEKNFYEAVDTALKTVSHNHIQDLTKSADYISGVGTSQPWFFISDQNEGVVIFEGDIDKCQNYDYTVSETFRQNGFGKCTQTAALEYCYRHSAELLLMNDEIKPIFEDLCYEVDDKSSVVNPLLTSLSKNAYWKNVRRDPFPVPDDENTELTFSTFSGFDWSNADNTNKGEFKGTDLNSEYDDSVKDIFSMTDNERLRLEYFNEWNIANPANSQECFDMKCSTQDSDLTSKQCDQTNTRPICLLDIWSYGHGVCIPNICGRRVNEYRSLRIMSAATRSDVGSTLNEDHQKTVLDNFKLMINQLQIANPTLNLPSVPNFHDVVEEEFCPCSCPLLPVFDDLYADQSNIRLERVTNGRVDQNSIVNGITQETFNVMNVQNTRGSQVRIAYCCQTGFRVVEDDDTVNFNFGGIGNSCVYIYCRDLTNYYVNAKTKTFLNEAGEVDSRINTGSQYFTKNTFTSSATMLSGRVPGRCQEVTCEASPTAISDRNILNIGSQLNHLTAVSSDPFSTVKKTVTFSCQKNFCGGATQSCIRDDSTNTASWATATGFCTAQKCQNVNLLNGNKNYISNVQSGGTKENPLVDESLQFTCNPGFELITTSDNKVHSEFTITCQSTVSENCLNCDDCGENYDFLPNVDFACRLLPCYEKPCDPSQRSNVITYPGIVPASGFTQNTENTCSCQENFCGEVEEICAVTEANPVPEWYQKSQYGCQFQFCQNINLIQGKREVNGIEKSSGTNILSKIGEQIKFSCKAGFILMRKDRINLSIETEVTDVTLTCQTDTKICSDCNTCQTKFNLTPEIDFYCKPEPCYAQPCRTVTGSRQEESSVRNSYDVGSKVNCICPLGYTGGGVMVCGASFGNHWSLESLSSETDANCQPMKCPKAKSIPHGSRKFEIANRPYLENEEITIGESVIYSCDSGFELFFSGTNERAELNSCARQCFLPPIAKKDQHNWSSIKPTLDPLVCECRPVLCPKHEISPTYFYTNIAETGADHNPVTDNEITLKCSSGFPSNEQTIHCKNDGQWTKPSECQKYGCVDPRRQKLEHNLDTFDHTYASLDAVKVVITTNVDDNLSTNTVERTDFSALKNSGLKYSNFNFEEDNDHHFDKFTSIRPLGGDFIDGSIIRMVCKRGFRPYYKPFRAKEMNNWKALTGNSYEVTCKNGYWESDVICRCESYDDYCRDQLMHSFL